MNPPPPAGSKRTYWICQIAGWYGYGTAQLVATHLIGYGPGPMVPFELFALYTAAIIATHGLRSFVRKRRWDALSPLQLTPRILATAVVLGLPLGIAQSFTSYDALNPQQDLSHPVRALLDASNWAAVFAIWMALYFIILGARQRRWAMLRQSELARALQAAQMQLLKSQLNPHFLFNSLNSVRALIAEDPSRAQHAVTQLARILRYSLGSSDQKELVTLEQELATVDDYLGLEALRLGDRLRIEREVSDDARRARLPVMLLQTIVENAIKHGIAELPQGGTLRIAAGITGDALQLVVENPRPASPVATSGQGLGLRNGAERLRLLFGADATLDLDLSQGGRAIARVSIPAGR
jgi:two-component system sensor histidine kinase AlgZ